MNNLKNNFISVDENKKNRENKEIKANECIGPCYPANYLFYNPLSFEPIINEYNSCPTKVIYKKDTNEYISSIKCDTISKKYESHDIFDETIFFCSSDYNFLKDVYEIYNLKDAVNYLNDEIDKLPYYSQKRILNSIFIVYGKYNDFPIKFFGDKVSIVIKVIYDKDIEQDKLYKKIINLKNIKDIKDIFINLTQK
jgi:hypothetical protein